MQQTCTHCWDARTTEQRACATEPSGSVPRHGSPCRDTVPKYAGWFGSRRRFFGLVSRQKFSVAIDFRARSDLGRDKGLLMSRQSFPRGGTFLLRHKTLCHDKNSKGGVATQCFSIATHRAGLRTQHGVGCARQA